MNQSCFVLLGHITTTTNVNFTSITYSNLISHNNPLSGRDRRVRTTQPRQRTRTTLMPFSKCDWFYFLRSLMFLIRSTEVYYSPLDLMFCFYIEKTFRSESTLAGMKTLFMRNSHIEKNRFAAISCASHFCFRLLDCVLGEGKTQSVSKRGSKNFLLLQDIIIGVGTYKSTMFG